MLKICLFVGVVRISDSGQKELVWSNTGESFKIGPDEIFNTFPTDKKYLNPNVGVSVLLGFPAFNLKFQLRLRRAVYGLQLYSKVMRFSRHINLPIAYRNNDQ